jgi:proteasome accessory factor B
VWQRAELAGAAAGGLLKLRAAGIEAEETARPGIEPRLTTEEASFGPLWRAVRDRRPVTFGYRAVGRTAVQARRLEPWGVVNRNGIWYVVGFDTNRGGERVFRLSRIEGQVSFAGPAGSVVVPPGTDVRKTVRDWGGAPPAVRTAELKIRPGTGYGLRRRPLADVAGGAGEGWDLVRTSFSDAGWYADYIASFGADVVVLEPVDLREAVIRKLKGVLA